MGAITMCAPLVLDRPSRRAQSHHSSPMEASRLSRPNRGGCGNPCDARWILMERAALWPPVVVALQLQVEQCTQCNDAQHTYHDSRALQGASIEHTQRPTRNPQARRLFQRFSPFREAIAEGCKRCTSWFGPRSPPRLVQEQRGWPQSCPCWAPLATSQHSRPATAVLRSCARRPGTRGARWPAWAMDAACRRWRASLRLSPGGAHCLLALRSTASFSHPRAACSAEATLR